MNKPETIEELEKLCGTTVYYIEGEKIVNNRIAIVKTDGCGHYIEFGEFFTTNMINIKHVFLTYNKAAAHYNESLVLRKITLRTDDKEKEKK